MSTRIRTIVTAFTVFSVLLTGATTFAAEKDRSRSTRGRKVRQFAVRPGRFEGPSIDGGKQQGTVRLRLPKVATDTTTEPDPLLTDTAANPAATAKAAATAKPKAPRTPKNVNDTTTAEPNPVAQVQQELAAPPFAQGAFSSSSPTPTVTGSSASSKRATTGSRAKQRGASSTRSRGMRQSKPRMR